MGFTHDIENMIQLHLVTNSCLCLKVGGAIRRLFDCVLSLNRCHLWSVYIHLDPAMLQQHQPTTRSQVLQILNLKLGQFL